MSTIHKPIPDADHLAGFDCDRCGHAATAHLNNPSCRACDCNRDPMCWCGRLTSYHEAQR